MVCVEILFLGTHTMSIWFGLKTGCDTLYLTSSLFSFHFQVKTHLNPTGWILGGVGIALLNTSLFLSESSSSSIASFHLIQSERCLHSTMVLGSGSLMRSATMVEKHELKTIVLRSNNSPELI
jgi:hypothetical protein